MVSLTETSWTRTVPPDRDPVDKDPPYSKEREVHILLESILVACNCEMVQTTIIRTGYFYIFRLIPYFSINASYTCIKLVRYTWNHLVVAARSID